MTSAGRTQVSAACRMMAARGRAVGDGYRLRDNNVEEILNESRSRR